MARLCRAAGVALVSLCGKIAGMTSHQIEQIERATRKAVLRAGVRRRGFLFLR